MIRLKESRLADLLPACIASNPEVQAFSHAVGRQVERLCELADACRTYAAVSALPDRLLDALAAELRTPAYSDDYPLDTKRALVRDSLSFHMQMGTPQAVNRIIRAIFGSGYIREWFEYGGEPYHFKAYTDNPHVTQSNVDEFIRAVSSVKRLSAQLDEIVLALSTPPVTQRAAHWLHTGDFITLKKAVM